MSQPVWHILTGEYPPRLGGVSDYTRLVACGLANAGDEVHVWTPARPKEILADTGVEVHGLTGPFGPHALAELERGLRHANSRRRLLVQYVPHAFGYKAMNVWLSLWLKKVSRRETIWVMFHEVCFPWGWARPLRHNFLGAVNRLMAHFVCSSAQRIFVSTPAWGVLLSKLARLRRPAEWLPVPSNVSTSADPEARAAVRRHVERPGGQILGHLGTFGDSITARLSEPLVRLLRADPRRTALLVGRNSKSYAEKLKQGNPDLANVLYATGGLEAESLAAHLAACDLLLQPYPDGVTTRRGSVMAGLALGLPILTTDGVLTESFWRYSNALQLIGSEADEWVNTAESLLGHEAQRACLGRSAARLYQERFSLECTVSTLRASELGCESP